MIILWEGDAYLVCQVIGGEDFPRNSVARCGLPESWGKRKILEIQPGYGRIAVG